MGYKRNFSATHREHLRQSALGRKHTPQTKQKISQAIKQKWMEATPTQATQQTEPTKPTQPSQPTQPSKNKNLYYDDK